LEATDKNSNSPRWGAMVGLGGKLISMFNYGAQIRFLGPDFKPSYYDAVYDQYRTVYYDQVSGSAGTTKQSVGYLAFLGASLLGDKIVLDISVDGPFGKVDASIPKGPADYVNYPHLVGTFTVAEGIVPNFSLDAYYDKKNIRSLESFLSAEGALIGTKLHYKTGIVMITFDTDVRYNPLTDKWVVTSGLETAVQF
jgi:hypothetical protein